MLDVEYLLFYFVSVSFLFFSLQRQRWAEGKIFLSKCCCLLALFLYGSIVLTVLTPTLFFMRMFVIDPITTNFKALLHSRDTTTHFWTMNFWWMSLVCIYNYIYFASCYICSSRHAHAHDTNHSITQPIYKHDAYTVLFVSKLGLVVTNHICEFYSFNYYRYHAVIFVIISFIIIIVPKVFFSIIGNSWGSLYGRQICRAFRKRFSLILL